MLTNEEKVLIKKIEQKIKDKKNNSNIKQYQEQTDKNYKDGDRN